MDVVVKDLFPLVMDEVMDMKGEFLRRNAVEIDGRIGFVGDGEDGRWKIEGENE